MPRTVCANAANDESVEPEIDSIWRVGEKRVREEAKVPLWPGASGFWLSLSLSLSLSFVLLLFLALLS